MSKKEMAGGINTGVKLTTRGRYAVMAMVELAQHSQSTPVPLSEIAGKSSISLSYLEQLFAGLRRHNLVRSYRGPGGGYILSRPPEQIQISEILKAAEDSVPGRRSANEDSPESYGNPQTYNLWSQMEDILNVITRRISLRDVMEDSVQDNAHINKLFDTLS